jgi:hypothetical protein
MPTHIWLFSALVTLTLSSILPLSAQAKECATLYEHARNAGMSITVQDGDEIDWIGNKWNDILSSFTVQPGCALTIYEDVDYGGEWETFTDSSTYIGDDWNDAVSSYACVCESAPVDTKRKPTHKPTARAATDTPWSQSNPIDFKVDGYHFTKVETTYKGGCKLHILWTYDAPNDAPVSFRSRVDFNTGSWMRSSTWADDKKGHREYETTLDTTDYKCWASRPATLKKINVTTCFSDDCSPDAP